MSDTPNFELSLFGEKLTARSGILELMEDLGHAKTVAPHLRMLAGGNPAAVPELQALVRQRMHEMLAEGDAFDRLIVNYDPPQGNPRFVHALADLLKRTFGWDVTGENIAVTAGGQSALFYLFNILAGRFESGKQKRILLAQAPEYIGYADQGIEHDLFTACRPVIDWPCGRESHTFKYRVDFDAVEKELAKGDIGAIAVSRPTNPTGNVLTDDEVRHLSQLTEQHGVPLIIDGAYGAPFPNVIFTEAEPHWAPHVILTLSLSKLGLPGTRTGMAIAPRQLADSISAMTAITGLANGNIGQQLVLPWIEDGSILEMGPKYLRPYYAEKSDKAIAWTKEAFDKVGVEWAMHASEGAFFHWLWLPGMNIPTRELYERLKQREVLIVPGEYFFFGLSEDWAHSRECIRVNYSGPEEVVREGLAIIADEVAKCR